MKVVTRYIAKEVLLYFTACVCIMVGVLLTARILKFAELVINKGVEPGQIALVFASIIPTFLEIAIPLSVLLGIMLAFARLSGDSEIIVLRASGISIVRLIWPVFLVGLLTTALSYAITMYLRPWGYRTLSQTLYEIARSTSTAAMDSGLFNRLGNLTLYTEEVDHQSGELRNVVVDDQRSESKRQIIFAKQGRIVPLPRTHSIGIALFDGVIHEGIDRKYVTTNFTTNDIILHSEEIFNPDARQRRIRESELSIGDLRQAIKTTDQSLTEKRRELESASAAPAQTDLDELEQLQESAAHYRLERDRRHSMPWAALLLALIGMPLGVQPPRAQKSWGAALSLALAVLVFALYYSLLSIGITLAESGVIFPFVALWLPNAVIAVLACIALYKIGMERWQSIADAFDRFLTPLKRRLQV